MTVLPPERESSEPEPERDWDAEFRAITGQISLTTEESSASQLEPAQPRNDPESSSSAGATMPERPSEAISSQDDIEDPDEDFVPQEPEPLAKDDPATVIMIGGLVAGPLWLVYLSVFNREARTLWWVLAALLLILGLALAVLRQPRTRDPEDPDDGARV